MPVTQELFHALVIAGGVSIGLVIYKKKLLDSRLDLADAFLIPCIGVSVALLYGLIWGPTSVLFASVFLLPIIIILGILGTIIKIIYMIRSRKSS